MPYLRFTRDRRGYENTYLIETVRRRGREHGRVLYWFRSPPQVKVGRAAIDEDAIRALEDAYPAIAFDWTRILEARPPDPEPPPEDARRRSRPRPPRDREREPRPEPSAPPEPSREPEPVPRVVEAAPVSSFGPTVDDVREDAAGRVAPDVPESAVDALPDLDTDEEAAALPAHASEPSAAARLLGSEGLLRLRARHAEVCARISAQPADPARQEALRALAERLNPDAWVTDADVKAGLEQFEQVLDEIRREVGPVRRRTRRGGRRNRKRRDVPAGDPNTTAAAPTGPADDETHTEDGEPDDEA